MHFTHRYTSVDMKSYNNKQNCNTISQNVLRGHICARVMTGTWAEGEASDVQAPFSGISYVVFGSYDFGKPLSSPT